ncbi:MAG: RsmE family RNA methyltransferase [Oscillospiraceae bacterium]
MPRFFCNNITQDKFLIAGEDAKHISKVLRYEIGDLLTISDMNGTDYQGVIENISGDFVTGAITSSEPCQNEPNIKLHLYMAMPKADKAELIVQKAVELGAYEIVFILTHRCVSRPDEKSFLKKLERFNKISFEAAKQSQRGIIPNVRGLLSYNKALDEISGTSGILFYENATMPLKNIIKNSSENISIIVGSEGGFEENEVTLAIEKSIAIASLGKRILRCETAPIAAISAIMYEKDNF